MPSSRRVALRILGATPLAACGATEATKGTADAVAEGGGADASSDAPTCAGAYQGGVDDFPGSTWRIVGVGAERIVLTRDDEGLYAYSALCTHGDCAIALTDAFGHARCPCHGAEFDGIG